MTSKKELKLALGLAVGLLLIGVICYAIPSKQPEEPVRLTLKCTAGRVLFTHKIHANADGYGIGCRDCHHHGSEDEDEVRKCTDCHFSATPKTVPEVCLDCHEPDENHHSDEELEARSCNDCHLVPDNKELPEACADCHDEGEIEGQPKPMKMVKIGDAFHDQCTGCHAEEEQGTGPLKDQCGKCHLK